MKTLFKKSKFSKAFLLVLIFFITLILSGIAIISSLKKSKVEDNNSNITVPEVNNIPQIAGLQNQKIAPESYPISYPINQNVKLLFVGDIMLARTIGQLIKNGKNPFENMTGFFKQYDLVIGNLETNISRPGIGAPRVGKLYTFNAPLQAIATLKNNGITIVSLANNHSMDYGGNALLDEINNLHNASIQQFGAGNNVNSAFAALYVTVNNTKIAFIGINDIENYFTKPGPNSPGSAYFDNNLVKKSIQTARNNADIVIVVPHWGIEYNLSITQRQKTLAHNLIDDGADIVIGSHPHVIEPSEIYKGKTIYYSMGNFVFDEMPFIPNAGKGYIVTVNIQNKHIINSQTANIRLTSVGFPELEN